MEILKLVSLVLGVLIITGSALTLFVLTLIKLHNMLHRDFGFYRRAFGLFVSFPISILRVLFYKKRKAIITYGGWIQLGYDKNDLIEYRLIGKLIKRKARIKDFLEYAEAVNYMEQNKSNTIFCEDYAYRKGLSITIEEYKNK